MSGQRCSKSEKQTRRPTRREILLGTMAGGAALVGGMGCAASSGTAAAGSAPDVPGAPEAAGSAVTPGASRPLGVALLGLGDYSEKQLGPSLRLTSHCNLRGIVTGTPAKIEKWQKEYAIADRNVYDYQSLPRVADNADIDVVYVVTPTALHAKYAIMAAEAGKHVWCEKPMAMTVEECQSIIDACKQNGVALAVGYRMHHEPNTQTVMQFAKTKPYGAIKNIRAIAGGRTSGHEGWRMLRAMGGGALYDMGVYSINAIRYASGEEPVRITRARQWADRPELFREVDESTEWEFELPSGATAYGQASRYNRENLLHVEAERGWYHLEPMQSYEGVKGETSDGKKLEQRVDKQQARQMDNEALAIIEKRPPVVPGEEGQRDVRLVQAIIESAQTGAPVTL
jgi:glucose-fructose oxidoreductase